MDKISLRKYNFKILWGEQSHVKKITVSGLLEFYFQTKGIHYV